MADYPSLLDFPIDDGAVDDDNSNDGDREKLPDHFKEILPFDFKEYMDKELECLPISDFGFFYGCVFWSRKDDKPERPPPLSDDIFDFNKKIRDVLCTTLRQWPLCTLVQFWAPITTSEGRSFLTTENQPFALKSVGDEFDTALIGLLKYRMISKDYKFYMDLDGESSGEDIGLLGRVFKHQLRESTPNVEYYSITEYPQCIYALGCQVRQSLAIPVFERSTQRCVGVLEVVNPMDCYTFPGLTCEYFCSNDKINEGFEKEGLKCSAAFDDTTMKLDVDKNEARALDEIEQVLRMVCKDRDLPFAQAWVPCKVGWPCKALGDVGILGVRFQYNKHNCYNTFQITSRNVHLKKGVGVVGTTLLSPNMIFCRDVTQFSLTEYPLAHYARYAGFSGCFAICLQSSCTGNDVYVLEVFMSVSNKANEHPYTTLSKIWETMRKKFRTFRFASGKQLCEELRIDEIDNRGKVDSVQLSQTTTVSLPRLEPLQSGGEIMQVDSSYQQLTNGISNGSSVDSIECNNIAITCAQEKGTLKTSQRIGNKAGVKINALIENLPDHFKENLPDDFKEYMDKELKCLPVLGAVFEEFIGCVFWSPEDDKLQRSPTLSGDILDFNKKIRDVLRTTLAAWPVWTLVQFWAPIRTSEGRFFLTTQNQPFALRSFCHQGDIARVIQLLRYRMICKDYKFYMDLDGESSGEEIGLLGRVFKHQLPESTPNVEYYSITEYPQLNDALCCQVRQSLAFPVFERSTQRCVGVLEVVTPMNSSLIWSYCRQNTDISKGFKKEGLKCPVAFDLITMKLDTAWDEIWKVLQTVCGVHNLPLAQTWVPCKVGWPCRALGDGDILGVGYQYNKHYYHAFKEASNLLHLKKGVGVVGTTLLSPNMVFCRDVTQFGLTEYPLAHYARSVGLSGCFAICLKSCCTGSDVYVLQFFMSVNKKASEIPHTKLSKIWKTMRKYLRNFRFASGEELCEKLRIDEIDNCGKVVDSVQLPQTTTISLPRSEPLQSGGEIMQVDSSYQQLTNGINNGSSVDGIECNNIAITFAQEKGTVKTSQRIGNTAGVKIKIPIEDILQTSEMRLEVAAKNLKVSKSTLKRVCRSYGFERWPPRKRDKVGPSQLNESIPCVDQQQIPRLNSDHLPSTRASTAIVHTKPHDTTMQDANIVTIKAKYGKDMIIKFSLSLSSRLVELQEQVAMRLNLESGTYYVKYKDEDSDLILIACDQDLQYYMCNSRSQGSTSIVVLLEPK